MLVIVDGMDDEPIPELGNLTPVACAWMPALSFMKRHGIVSHKHTVPEGLMSATEIALLTILGIPVGPDFNARSWLEALGGGISVGDNDLILRCNLISHHDGTIVSHCGFNPSPQDCRRIVDILNDHFGGNGLFFHNFDNFRCLLVIHDCLSSVIAMPPHALLGQPTDRLQVKSADSVLECVLNQCIAGSRGILEGYKANGIALWAPGRAIKMSRQIQGTVVAGVNIVKGIGRALGMTVVDVPGATGDEFTDYAAKLKAVLAALEKDDFVLLHIEATDEASHQLDWQKKVSILEEIDRQILTPLLYRQEQLHITVQSDHATSSLTGHHLNIPVSVVDYNLNG